MKICESPLARNDSTSNNFSLYSNCMWNIIITMTTVGYGDFYARTDLGRFTIFIVCIFGIFVLSMMMVTLMSSLTTTSLEGKAITVLQRLEVRQEMIE
jgi:potassium intermediate/small conductance calcium-activated channel subfamily N protein 2